MINLAFKSISLNKIINYLLVVFLYCYFTNNTLEAKNVQSKDKNTLEFVNSPDLKSIKTHKMGWELSEPSIELNGNDKLVVTFDDLSESPGTFAYTITHCNSEWEPTPIFYSDYMDGFEVNEIRDYNFSSGSIISYMHCRVEIPNDDVRLKISGNYIISIFNAYQPEEVLIQRRFIVYEQLISITANIRQPSAGEYRYSGQQMDLKIGLTGVRVSNPSTEIKTVVCQNYQFQGCIQNVKPVYFIDNEIDYSQPDALIFEGGNEFRIFDTKNIRYQAQGIQSIDFNGGMFHVQLKPDKSRRRDRYTNYSDLNGRFVVSLEQSNHSEIEADYVWTYFSLSTPMELDEGKSVYLFGELTGWQLSPNNKMTYNINRGAYEIRLLLKQGAYSYRYVVANDKTGEVDINHYEGSYFDTENSYMVMVYFKPMGARYERVIGYSKLGTQR